MPSLRVPARPLGRARCPGRPPHCNHKEDHVKVTGQVFNNGVVNFGGELTMEGCVVGEDATIVIVDGEDDDE
jgi:hypothetical protein